MISEIFFQLKMYDVCKQKNILINKLLNMYFRRNLSVSFQVYESN